MADASCAVGMAILVVACGSGGGISGSVAGHTLSPRDSASVAATPAYSNFAGYKSAMLTIFISDATGICGAAQQNAMKASSTSLALSVGRFCCASSPPRGGASLSPTASP